MSAYHTGEFLKGKLTKMTSYLIAVESSSAAELAYAMAELGGKPIHQSCGIAPWPDTADELSNKLRLTLRGHIVVCRLDSDWTYR
jgi:hypothetical protein